MRKDPLRPYLNRAYILNKELRDSDNKINKMMSVQHINLIHILHTQRRGLDLCFWTCGMSRVMWLTKDARYCFYWNRSNGRSKRFFSAEKQSYLKSKVYF